MSQTEAMNGTSVQSPTNGGDDKAKTMAMDERFPVNPEMLQPEQKKKKKKNNNFKGRGPTALLKNRGTGFEDYFCDPPMTPAEAAEEKNEIYSPDRPFVDRIEACIQRYRARRRMDPTRLNLFNKYLGLGGIDTSPRMFQGMKTMDMGDATNDEIRGMTAGDVIHRGSDDSRFYNPFKEEEWDVDFSGVVAGYFSERIFKLAGTDLQIIKTAADVVENFINYVLHHDVCPEYTDDLYKAKAICRESVDQITGCFKVTWESPGDLSIACLVLFDHGKRKVFNPDSNSVRYTMPKQQAQLVFYTNVAVHRSLFHQLASKPNKTEVVDEVKQAFEVVAICPPTEKQAAIYRGVQEIKGEKAAVPACGKLTLKPIDMQDGHDKGSASGPAPGIAQLEEFVIDWSVLEPMTVGMKLKLVLCVLNNGNKFVKAFTDVRPRYYKFLAQELMLNFKEPVPNEREAPSVASPDAGVDNGADARALD